MQIEGTSLPLHEWFFALQGMEIEEFAVVIKMDNDEGMDGTIGEDEMVICARVHYFYNVKCWIPNGINGGGERLAG